MNELFSGWRFVAPRIRSSWRLLSVTALGVLVAAALLGAVPIYSSALSTLGLQFRLDRALSDSRLNTVEVNGLAPGDGVDLQRRAAINEIFDARVGWLAEGGERLVQERSPRLLLDFTHAASVGAGGELFARQPWNAFLYALSGFAERVTVTEGRLPDVAGEAGPEVVLPDGFQRHAALGDTVVLRQQDPFNDCEMLPGSLDPSVAANEVPCSPTTTVSETLIATIVGFVRPNDPADPRWEIFSGSFSVPGEPLLPHVDAALAFDAFGGGINLRVVNALAGEGSMPLLTISEQLFGPITLAAPYLPMDRAVGLLADVRAIGLDDVPRGIEGTRLLREDIDQRLGLVPLVRFPVADVLERFRNTQTFEQVPLLIILLQVVGIVVYYVAVVASMLVKREAEEISVYRSRGASSAQLVGFYLMEGLAIVAVAVAVAPWLAGQGVAALGYAPTFSALSDGGALPVSVNPSAYLLAAAGAGLALLALLLPAFAFARQGIVDVKRQQARPPGRSVFQRYYLDIGAVVLAALLLWQLGQRGTVFYPEAVGGWSGDPLLLLSPFVFTLAVAALVLRFYPVLVRSTVGLLLAAGGTAVALGLRRAARAPSAYARLMLLLVMAISVGTFAASYGPTVDRSQGDRVRYATGTDMRGGLRNADISRAEQQLPGLLALDGVDDAVFARRDEVRSVTGLEIDVLALDPVAAKEMLWFRDDFLGEGEAAPRWRRPWDGFRDWLRGALTRWFRADDRTRSLQTLMRGLQSDVPSGGGIPLGDGVEAVRLSVLATEPREHSTLWVRFRDVNGNYANVRAGPLDFGGWRELTVPLPGFGSAPFTFVGLRVSESRGSPLPRPGALYVDDVMSIDPGGNAVLLDDFERDAARFGWSMFGTRASTETFELSDEQSVSGGHAAKWSWPLGAAPGGRFLLMDAPNVPPAVIVNAEAGARLGAAVGGVGQMMLGDVVVPVRVQAQVEMFPTLSPDAPFMVLNLGHLTALADMLNVARYGTGNEVWISTSLPLEQQRVLAQTVQGPDSPLRLTVGFRHQAAELELKESDPTLQASGSGILTAAFSAVLGLAMVGFLVTLVLGARNRLVEFAVLRAVGSSGAQILRSMVLEWGVVLVIGSAIGVLLGRRVAGVMLSFLDVTEAGDRVVPPFVLETDWLALALGVGALTAVAAGGLALVWGSSLRHDTAVELRLTR